MILTNLKYIKAELQSLGVRIKRDGLKKGGAGPAEGDTIFLQNDLVATVPAGSDFVKESPFEIAGSGNEFILLRAGNEVCGVTFPGVPAFYGHSDPDGIPFWKIAQRHGRDCLATTVVQKCVYWNTERQCRFCGIELSLEAGRTIAIKSPEQLAEAAVLSSKLDGLKHVTLTTGTTPDWISPLAGCVRAIKQKAGIPVHVQIEPLGSVKNMEILNEAGADTIGIHIESFDMDVLKALAPAKASYGIKKYTEFWEYAVKLFGKNQVSTFLIAGLGESEDSIIEGCRHAAGSGVYPYVIPLRPIPGSLLQNSMPPSPESMIRIYERAAFIIKESGLSAAGCRAGCVRCGACSAITDFEQD